MPRIGEYFYPNVGESDTVWNEGFESNARLNSVANLDFLEVSEKINIARSGVDSGYILAGDSTRAVSGNEIQEFYSELLGQVGVRVIDSAKHGETTQSWIDESWGLQYAIDNAVGVDGENTILEYSFGLNDRYNGRSEADIKASMIAGIDSFLVAKPKATIILASPVYASDLSSTSREILSRVYNEVSTEYGYKLVDVMSIMEPITNNPLYYVDPVHLTWYGARRVCLFVLSSIISPALSQYITVTERMCGINKPNTNQLNVAPYYEDGQYYSESDGGDRTGATWTRTPKFTVTENTTITWNRSNGNQSSCLMYDSGGDFVKRVYGLKLFTDGEVLRVRIPKGVVEVGFNVTSSLPTLVKNNVPTYYQDNSEIHVPTIDVIDGFQIPFKTTNLTSEGTIDMVGSEGVDGDTLTKLSSKMVWS